MDEDIPAEPPLEIVKQGRLWVIEEYRLGLRDGTVYSSHDTQMEAVRRAKAKMDEDNHPCTVRWESEDSVQNVYWNPLFEALEVRYDEFFDEWTVIPAEGTMALKRAHRRETAFELGKQLQRECNFKYLRVFDRRGEHYEEREHRFLRHNITDSGVRFDREKLAPVSGSDESDDEKAAASDIEVTQPATPSTLGVSVPDVTRVEFVDTDGVIHRYASPWGDGTYAEIIALSQKYGTHEQAREAFQLQLDIWQKSDNGSHVASIYETGMEPTPWVAYRSSKHSLGTLGMDLPLSDRQRLVEDLVAAVETVSIEQSQLCGIRPTNIGLRDSGKRWRLAVANWGIEWETCRAVSIDHVTPFTTPEQLGGELADTTAVYQVAAVAYWLLCESLPVPENLDEETMRRTIMTGDLTPPKTIRAVPPAVEPILETALSTDPDDRYDTVTVFYEQLTDAL